MRLNPYRLIYTVIIVVIASLADVDTSAQRRRGASRLQRTTATVKKERQSTREAIKKANRQLEANKLKTQRTLNDLDLINADIDGLDVEINTLQIRIDTLTAVSNRMADTVATLDRRLETMRQTYAKSVKATRNASNSRLTRLALIFASESFTQAYRRMRYLREYTDWQSHQATDIREKKLALDSRRATLDSMRSVRSMAIDSLKKTRATLDARQKKADKLVKDLKKQEKALRQVLIDNEKRAKDLDSELNRLIAQEQKKAAEEARRKAAEEAKNKSADKKTPVKPAPVTDTAPSPKQTNEPPTGPLGGTFDQHQGKLPFPVDGNARIVRGFGKQQHPQLPKVTINNSGIDIEASKGASAHAVFDGKVSAIFQQKGFNNIVMVRHGEYLTIYANLAKINVKNGQTVSQGQTLGTIYSDPSDNNRTTLHFEIRREKEKLNPTLWLKPHQ